MSRHPDATLHREWNDRGESCWVLVIGSRTEPRMTASYPTEEAALADYGFWCGPVALPLAQAKAA